MAKRKDSQAGSYRKRRKVADGAMTSLIQEGLHRAWDASFMKSAETLPHSTATAFDRRFWLAVEQLASTYLARSRTAREMGVRG